MTARPLCREAWPPCPSHVMALAPSAPQAAFLQQPALSRAGPPSASPVAPQPLTRSAPSGVCAWAGLAVAAGAAASVAGGHPRRRRWQDARVVAVAAESRTQTVNPASNEPAAPRDYPKPSQIDKTQNYKESAQLSKKFRDMTGAVGRKRVAIVGGGLSGLACAKYLADAGHEPIVLEAREVLGGKVSAWQDEDGDWIETGLHIFFGAYPNMMNLFSELGIEDRLQWKRHQMVFAMQELPGEFTTFDFFEGVPAPLNLVLAILLNQKMLTLPEKLQMGPPLLPMLIEGQTFIDAQDDLSVTEFMRKYGMPDRINDEVFVAIAKALDFIDPDKLSMTVVLTAMNRFLNETDGSQTAFLDGNQPERLCAPMVKHVEARGGKVRTGAILDRFELNDDGSIRHLVLRGGEVVEANEYVSAVPCDIMRRLVPEAWARMPYFRQIDELEGIPVVNIHLLRRRR